jgi:oxygen-independent coproporphyrinogen-3 oxidase
MFPAITEDLVRRYDIPAPRYTSYPTAPVWTQWIGPAAYAQALEEADAKAALPMSLYAHVPFCRERCTFCGCNVVIARRHETADRYLDALERELDAVAAHLPHRRQLSQIHWGGGTPTFLDERQITRLWKAITARFRVLPSAEVSVEVNPEVTSLEQISLLRELGFNRVSMGVQDLDPQVQEGIRRHQTFAMTQGMVEHARKLGFRGINFDLIYGLPLQTKESWARTLAQVIELRPDRMAVYAFAFVPDIKPHQKRLEVLGIPRGAPKLELFRQAYEGFTSAGYRPIGMDHFALAGDELCLAQERRSLTRNFQGYTVQAATDVVAIGASAISDIGGIYAQNEHVLPKYEEAALAGKLCVERGVALTPEDRRRRALITQLMCNFYVDLGQDGEQHFASELQRLRELEKEGMLRVSGHEVELTEMGRVFVRNIAMVFDQYLGPQERRFSRAV